MFASYGQQWEEGKTLFDPIVHNKVTQSTASAPNFRSIGI